MTRWVFVEVWDTLSAILVTCVNVNKLVFQQKQSTIFKKKEGRKKKPLTLNTTWSALNSSQIVSN